MSPAPSPAPSGNAKLIAGTILLIATMAGWIYLRDNENQSSGLLLFVIPIITGLFVSHGSEIRNEETQQKLDVIKHQTNGEIDRKVREGTRESVLDLLTELGLASPPPATPAPEPAASNDTPPAGTAGT